MPKLKKETKAEKAAATGLNSPQALNQAVWKICDVLRAAGVGSAIRYVPELTWILFLRVLDEQETIEREEAETLGLQYEPSLASPYRWQDWAATPDYKNADQPNSPKTSDGKPLGWKRRALQEAKLGSYFAFVNGELLPWLRKLRDQPGATAKQKVISEIIAPIERVRIDTESNFADVLDRVHALLMAGADTQHQFMLSQVYEGLLLKMGEKNSDGGQFYTPREVIRAMVKVVNPRIGQTVCDPCCGTAGFLAEAAEHMRATGGELSTEALQVLKHETFYGREKDNLAYPIALANLMLHGIDEPHLWHGNTLSNQTIYGGLWEGAPDRFHVVLTNPPFGGKEGKEAQGPFPFKTRSTQVLFVQQVMQSLAPGGVCGIVLDEGFLYRTNEEAFIKTKRKLLDEFDVWCVVSLPGGAFSGSGAGVKTNLVFFTRGRRTERIWYYDLSTLKIGKKTPLTLAQFSNFFALLDQRATPAADTALSWTVDLAERRRKAAADAAPHRLEAEQQRELAAKHREQAKALRKAGKAKAADALLTAIDNAEKQARDATAKAEAIDAAVYDLKAVNPSEKKTSDTRTPSELLQAIAVKGLEVEAAVGRLRELLAQT